MYHKESYYNGITALSIEKATNSPLEDILISNLWGCVVTQGYLNQKLTPRPEVGPFKKRPFYYTYDLSKKALRKITWDRVEIPGSNYFPSLIEATSSMGFVHMWTVDSIQEILFAIGYKIVIEDDLSVTLTNKRGTTFHMPGKKVVDELFDLLVTVEPRFNSKTKDIVKLAEENPVEAAKFIQNVSILNEDEPLLYII